MHIPCGHIGVKTAGIQVPSAEQNIALHQPLAQLVAQSAPVLPQLFDAIFRLAASDDATDIAIAIAATAPTTRNFVANFIIVRSSPFIRSPNIQNRFDDHG
jgi:hypothetical protein